MGELVSSYSCEAAIDWIDVPIRQTAVVRRRPSIGIGNAWARSPIEKPRTRRHFAAGGLGLLDEPSHPVRRV